MPDLPGPARGGFHRPAIYPAALRNGHAEEISATAIFDPLSGIDRGRILSQRIPEDCMPANSGVPGVYHQRIRCQSVRGTIGLGGRVLSAHLDEDDEQKWEEETKGSNSAHIASMTSKRLPVIPAGPRKNATDYRSTLSVIFLTVIGDGDS